MIVAAHDHVPLLGGPCSTHELPLHDQAAIKDEHMILKSLQGAAGV